MGKGYAFDLNGSSQKLTKALKLIWWNQEASKGHGSFISFILPRALFLSKANGIFFPRKETQLL